MLVGFTGRAGVGKSTIAHMFRFYHGAEVVSFATPLKECLARLTGMSMDYFTDSDLKDCTIYEGWTPRTLMQFFGTEVVRNQIASDFWVRRMEITLNILKDHDHVMIDDCRFEDEAQFIRDQGGVVIHLRRDGFDSAPGHVSEQQLVVYDNDHVVDSGDKDETYTFKCIKESILYEIQEY